MNSVILDYILKIVSFSWLTGPVFDKELRVSSRKRRNYSLRSAYISLLLILLLFVWISMVDFRGTNVLRISRMALAGRTMVTCIVWFQFCVAQLIAVVMLSNSISDEIYHKTLGTLMTTPITSLQIVIGKLLSKLLQLLLLLAISLPLLALARVFGGVSWSYVISSLCITLSVVLLASSFSLFYSIFCRRAYVVIIVTVFTFLILYGLFPFLYISFVQITEIDRTVPHDTLEYILIQPNPYITFFINSEQIFYSGNFGGLLPKIPYINSVINIVLSLILILISIIMVRRVALRQATGQLLSYKHRKNIKKEKRLSKSNRNQNIARVIGPPIMWKEMILPLRRGIKILRIIGVILFIALIFYSYWFVETEDSIRDDDVQAIYVIIFMGLGALLTIVISSVSITSEKESQAWPLLLTSTLKDSQIVLGKLYGIFCRCMPIWFLLLGHIIYFYFHGVFHPAAIILASVLVTWFVFFICSSGMYFSSVYKHTTTAVIMNFAFVIIIWGIIPIIFGILGELSNDRDMAEACFYVNPFIQILVIIFSTINGRMQFANGQMKFSWPTGWEKFDDSMFAFGISFCLYMIIALIFLWRAKKRIRYKVF